MYIVLSRPLKRTILLLMLKEVPVVVNVLVVRLLLDIVPVVEIAPVDVISITLNVSIAHVKMSEYSYI